MGGGGVGAQVERIGNVGDTVSGYLKLMRQTLSVRVPYVYSPWLLFWWLGKIELKWKAGLEASRNRFGGYASRVS